MFLLNRPHLVHSCPPMDGLWIVHSPHTTTGVWTWTKSTCEDAKGVDSGQLGGDLISNDSIARTHLATPSCVNGR